MKQLHCINIMRICIVLLLFFYAEGAKVIGQNVMRQTANPRTLHINKTAPITYNNGCECINKYYCGCCQFIEWDAVSLNGTLCGNASYLDHDYGISITLTYNNVTLINETVTVKDAPPICVGNFVSSVFDICLQISDVKVNSNGFHACFEILGKIMKFEMYKLELGCIGSMLKYSISPNVIIVYPYSTEHCSNIAAILQCCCNVTIILIILLQYSVLYG